MRDNEDYGDTRERIEKNTMVFPSLTKAGSVAISKGGMTLRQYYAGQMMAAIIVGNDAGYCALTAGAARDAIAATDALIAELEK